MLRLRGHRLGQGPVAVAGDDLHGGGVPVQRRAGSSNFASDYRLLTARSVSPPCSAGRPRGGAAAAGVDDHLVHAAGRLVGHDDGHLAPVAVERAGRHLVDLHDAAALARRASVTIHWISTRVVVGARRGRDLARDAEVGALRGVLHHVAELGQLGRHLRAQRVLPSPGAPVTPGQEDHGRGG